jgi:predicted nucleic-acid-binding protein
VIALDTNVLVRFLVEDDETQHRAARNLIARAGRREEALHVSEVTLCETVWVLSAAYGVPRDEIVTIVHRLLHARQLSFRAPDVLADAVDAFALGKGDFADYVIREDARAAGASTVATFDKSLLKEAGFSKVA